CRNPAWSSTISTVGRIPSLWRADAARRVRLTPLFDAPWVPSRRLQVAPGGTGQESHTRATGWWGVRLSPPPRPPPPPYLGRAGRSILLLFVRALLRQSRKVSNVRPSPL